MEATKGALIGGAIGAPAGGFSNLLDYMKEHGTIDGSTNDVLEGMSEGFVKGAFAGAIAGFLKGSMDYYKNPDAYCFVAGTLVATAVGMSCIEDIRPGDYVYAKNEATGEQAYMPVLETYINEIYETYTVTINGESIETTPGHPFYTTDRGWVGADKLKAGDSVELSDGSSAEVESVERNEFEEPVIIYNLCVMDYHTYYVGENEVLVHNVGGCGPGAIETVGKTNPFDLQPTHSQTLSKNKMNALMDDIKINGIQEPIKYVDYNGQMYVVDGHHRLLAAKRLGLTEVPIEKVDLPYAGYNTIDDLFGMSNNRRTKNGNMAVSVQYYTC